MKKILVISGGAIVALLLVVFIGGYFFLGSIVTKAVNTIAPRITKAPVTLESARISPLTGSGSLTGLFVGNPDGWNSPKAFSVGKIDVGVSPTSLLSGRVVVDHIIVENPEFVYETRLVASNVGDLLKNIEASLGGSDSSSSGSDSGSSRKIEIRQFVVRDGSITLGVGAAAVKLPMPTIELNNLGGGDGVSPAEATAEMMRAVTGSIVKVVTEQAMPAIGNAGSSATDAAKAGADAVRKTGDAIKGLLGGKK